MHTMLFLFFYIYSIDYNQSPLLIIIISQPIIQHIHNKSMINNKIHQEHEHDNHRSDENNDILASLNETDHRQQHSSDYIKENNT